MNLNRNETLFMNAMQAYNKGTPIITDAQFDELKLSLKNTNSKIAGNFFWCIQFFFSLDFVENFTYLFFLQLYFFTSLFSILTPFFFVFSTFVSLFFPHLLRSPVLLISFLLNLDLLSWFPYFSLFSSFSLLFSSSLLSLLFSVLFCYHLLFLSSPPFSVSTEPKCYVDTGVCKVTWSPDTLRTTSLYVPAVLLSTIVWIGLVSILLINSVFKRKSILWTKVIHVFSIFLFSIFIF